MSEQQNFANHTKFFPFFHFFVLPIMVLNFAWSIHLWIVARYSLDGFIWVLTSTGLLALAFASRAMALKAQDRVIRLEERMRLAQLLPPDLQLRIGEFTSGQLVALRFASDGELPDLCRKVLAEKLEKGKAIKQQIKVWRPDHHRV